MLRCSNQKCDNHKPNVATYFNWTMPYVQVTPDRTVIDDVKTEIAYCFSCPECSADAEDYDVQGGINA
jgi:hypothetical protein